MLVVSSWNCPEPWAPMRHPWTGDDKPRAVTGTVYRFGSLVIVVDERTFRVRLAIVAPFMPASNWRRT